MTPQEAHPPTTRARVLLSERRPGETLLSTFANFQKRPASVDLFDHEVAVHGASSHADYFRLLYGADSQEVSWRLHRHQPAGGGLRIYEVRLAFLLREPYPKRRLNAADVEKCGFLPHDRLKASYRDELICELDEIQERHRPVLRRAGDPGRDLGQRLQENPDLAFEFMALHSEIELLVHPALVSYLGLEPVLAQVAVVRRLSCAPMQAAVRYQEDIPVRTT